MSSLEMSLGRTSTSECRSLAGDHRSSRGTQCSFPLGLAQVGPALAGKLVGQESREGISALFEKETPNFKGWVGWPNPEPQVCSREGRFTWTLCQPAPGSLEPSRPGHEGNCTSDSEGPQGNPDIRVWRQGPLSPPCPPGCGQNHRKPARTQVPAPAPLPHTLQEHPRVEWRPRQRHRHGGQTAGRACRHWVGGGGPVRPERWLLGTGGPLSLLGTLGTPGTLVSGRVAEVEAERKAVGDRPSWLQSVPCSQNRGPGPTREGPGHHGVPSPWHSGCGSRALPGRQDVGLWGPRKGCEGQRCRGREITRACEGRRPVGRGRAPGLGAGRPRESCGPGTCMRSWGEAPGRGEGGELEPLAPCPPRRAPGARLGPDWGCRAVGVVGHTAGPTTDAGEPHGSPQAEGWEGVLAFWIPKRVPPAL